jgi:hypothetical protein
VSQPGLTHNHLLYAVGAFDKALAQRMADKTGILGRFSIGTFAFKRFGEERKAHPAWNEAVARAGGTFGNRAARRGKPPGG